MVLMFLNEKIYYPLEQKLNLIQVIGKLIMEKLLIPIL